MITTVKEEQTEIKYPCLMINNNRDIILYVVGETEDGLYKASYYRRILC